MPRVIVRIVMVPLALGHTGRAEAQPLGGRWAGGAVASPRAETGSRMAGHVRPLRTLSVRDTAASTLHR